MAEKFEDKNLIQVVIQKYFVEINKNGCQSNCLSLKLKKPLTFKLNKKNRNFICNFQNYSFKKSLFQIQFFFLNYKMDFREFLLHSECT